MANEGLISREEAIFGSAPSPSSASCIPKSTPVLSVTARGLGASPGAATGKIALTPEEAVEAAGRGEAVSPSDERPPRRHPWMLLKAEGIPCKQRRMTSHAAVVARGDLEDPHRRGSRGHRDEAAQVVRIGAATLSAGDIITLDGADGSVMQGAVRTIQSETRPEVDELMGWVDTVRRLDIYTNADTARRQVARDFGAQGIGLCRTEHMFFDGERILAVREMILASDEVGRRQALAKILMQKGDFKALFEVMNDFQSSDSRSTAHEFHQSADPSALRGARRKL